MSAKAGKGNNLQLNKVKVHKAQILYNKNEGDENNIGFH